MKEKPHLFDLPRLHIAGPHQAREEPLPESEPKPPADDPQAPEAIDRILRSPTYQRADLDLDFLSGERLRHVRLQLDYLKAENTLRDAAVTSTLVVFGGTRIREPNAAQRRVDEAEAALAASPEEPELRLRVRIARRLLAKSRYYHEARRLAQMASEAAKQAGAHLLIATGGGPGVMEAANRGAGDVGARSIGFNITLPHEQYPNPYITPELCFQFKYFAIRKLHFLLRARALIAFPGGYGTLDELFETLCLIQTRKVDPLPVVLVGEEFWRGVFNAEFLALEGVIDPEDLSLFWYAETAEEVWQSLVDWYAQAGESVFDHEQPVNA